MARTRLGNALLPEDRGSALPVAAPRSFVTWAYRMVGWNSRSVSAHRATALGIRYVSADHTARSASSFSDACSERTTSSFPTIRSKMLPSPVIPWNRPMPPVNVGAANALLVFARPRSPPWAPSQPAGAHDSALQGAARTRHEDDAGPDSLPRANGGILNSSGKEM